MALRFLTASEQYITGSGFTGAAYNADYTWIVRLKTTTTARVSIMGARDHNINDQHLLGLGGYMSVNGGYQNEDNNNKVIINSSIDMADGAVHTAVATHTTLHAMELIVDGVSQGTDTGAAVVLNLEAQIGRKRTLPDTYHFYYQGYILEVRIYTRILSLAEAKIIHFSQGNDNITNGLYLYWRMNEKPDGQSAAGAGVIIDLSGNSRNGTPVNSPVYQPASMRLINPFQTTRTAYKQTKTLTESITLGDTLVKAPAKILTESIILADTLQKKPAKIFTESITLADTLQKKLSKLFTEAITLTDIYSRVWNIYRTFTETLSLADTLIKKPIKTFIESLHLTDTLIKRPAKIFLESISLSDIYSKVWNIYRTFTETLSLTDRVSKKAVKSFLEVLHLQDRYTRVVTWYRTFTENITLTDTVKKVKSNLVQLFKKLMNLFDIEG